MTRLGGLGWTGALRLGLFSWGGARYAYGFAITVPRIKHTQPLISVLFPSALLLARALEQPGTEFQPSWVCVPLTRAKS